MPVFVTFKVCLFFRLEQFSSNMFSNNYLLLIIYFHTCFVFIWRYILKKCFYYNFIKNNLFYGWEIPFNLGMNRCGLDIPEVLKQFFLLWYLYSDDKKARLQLKWCLSGSHICLIKQVLRGMKCPFTPVFNVFWLMHKNLYERNFKTLKIKYWQRAHGEIDNTVSVTASCSCVRWTW